MECTGGEVLTIIVPKNNIPALCLLRGKNKKVAQKFYEVFS